MFSMLKITDGHEAGSNTIIGNTSGLPVTDQQSPNNMLNQLGNPRAGQGIEENVNRQAIAIFGGCSRNIQDNVGEGNNQRKKRYHRHSQYQIQELESFFGICPAPNEKQRRELGSQLGLTQGQVKFWFQNKRTQVKMRHERNENQQARVERERLLAENAQLRSVMRNTPCSYCGDPNAFGGMLSIEDQNLCVENSQLRVEISRMATFVAKYVGQPMPSVVQPHSVVMNEVSLVGATGGEPYAPGWLHTEKTLNFSKNKTVELAVAAMEEFLQMANVVEPLWTPVVIGADIIYSLNDNEYFQAFLNAPSPRRVGFRYEATRDSSIVRMNHLNLIEALMDVNKWATIFCGVVAKARHLELLSTGGAGNYNGAIQVIDAEFQMITPFVPTRETIMARLCKHHGNDTWTVVDVSLDELLANPAAKFHKRPSGCLIQKMSNGCSKITWIEHVEVKEESETGIYASLINSGTAFGAKYWLSILNRQCERFAYSVATEFPPGDATNIEGRRRMLKVAERMVLEFCNSSCHSSSNRWQSFSQSGTGMEDLRVMTSKKVYYNCTVISVATSVWLPNASSAVFNYFRNENNRSRWDILNDGAEISKVAQITTGENDGNCISLLQLRATLESLSNTFILQESFTYPTGSFIIYSLVDPLSMSNILNGVEGNGVFLLPSGFAILPDDPTRSGLDRGQLGTGGTALSLVFQVMVAPTPETELSTSDITTVNNLVVGTFSRIKRALEKLSA